MRNNIYLFILCIIFCGYHINAQNYWLTEQPDFHINTEVICGVAEANPDNDPLGGGFLLSGFIREEYFPFLIRIDRYGNELWRKYRFDFEHIPSEDGGTKVSHYTEDGNFLVGSNWGLMKINSETGEEMWDEVVGTPENPAVMYIEKYGATRYIIIKFLWNECFTFDISTQKVIKPLDFGIDWENFCVKLTTDGKFIFSGEYYYSNEDEYKLTLCRTNTDLEYDNSFGYKG